MLGLTVCVALGAVLAAIRVHGEATQWVAHTHEVLRQIERTSSTLNQAETDQRGYLLTGDARMLGPFQIAVTLLPHLLDHIQQLTADNPVQGRNIEALRVDVSNKLDAMGRSIVLADAGQPRAALEIVRGQGSPAMGQLRVDFSRMQAEEERLLSMRAAAVSRTNVWIVATVIVMGILAVLALGVLRTLMAKDATQIRLSEERLATTVASVGDAVIATDAQGHVERMNPVAEQLTGWSIGEAAGMPLDTVFRIINGVSRNPVESPVDKVLREGKVVGLANHTFLIAKDGTERPIEDSGAPIRGPDGVITGVVLVFKDASARYAAERLLADSEARFRELAENIPTLCWMADETGAIFWYNSRWYEYTGTTLEQMQGWGWQSVHDPAMLPLVVERWTAALASGLPFEMVFPLKGADGKFREFLTRVAPQKNHDGRIIRWLGINTDVTEQRAAEADLREADRRKDEFIATLAHELRNPLAPIRNAVKLLKPELPSETQAKARSIIERQATQMASLLDDLLDVSRITRGQVQLRLEVLDLRRIVENVILDNRALVERLHHELRVHVAGDPLLVEGDSTRLYQILDNLVQNAAKYTDPGGQIELNAYAQDNTVVIQVKDTGIGVAPESIDRMFDLFSQVHTAERGRSGLGIGLAVVKRLVGLHGGAIAAQSEGVGRGTCFRLTFPQAAGLVAMQSVESSAGISTLYRNRPRVLLVDDHPDILESLALLLRGEGYSVHTAEDGVAAIQVSESLCPDVMVIDIGMPKMDGYQVARWVRHQSWGGRTRLIAVTGWGQEGDRRRTRDAGFDEHLVKPVDPDALMRLIDTLPSADSSTGAGKV